MILFPVFLPGAPDLPELAAQGPPLPPEADGDDFHLQLLPDVGRAIVLLQVLEESLELFRVLPDGLAEITICLERNPCFRALRRTFALPCGVLGPVEWSALRRFASTFCGETDFTSDLHPALRLLQMLDCSAASVVA